MGPGSHLGIADSANGIRTRVPALRGLCPRPLDDSAAYVAGREHKEPPPLYQQARQESNLQPPVLETGALPIELRTFDGRVGEWAHRRVEPAEPRSPCAYAPVRLRDLQGA